MRTRSLLIIIPLLVQALACTNNKVNDDTIHVTDFSLDKNYVTVVEGDSIKIEPIFVPSYCTNKTVAWESENAAVASVRDGWIKGIAKGEVVVTCTCADGDITTPCNVTVISSRQPVRPSGGNWKSVKVAPGLFLYTFEGKDVVSNMVQYVCVADIDTTIYQLHFCYPGDSKTSGVFKSKNAYVAMNGAYETGSVFIKIDGSIKNKVMNETIMSTGILNWKSDGAVCIDKTGAVSFLNAIFREPDEKGTGGYGLTLAQQRTYFRQVAPSYTSILSSSPILIWDYNPIGAGFVPTTVDPYSIKASENAYHHQGYNHPRTVIGIDCQGHILMVVGDGRYSKNAVGWSARNLTNFLVKYFDPQYALNMDGGGSTCMCVKDQGNPTTHVVNHPCDSGSWDSPGERTVSSFFYVVKK